MQNCNVRPYTGPEKYIFISFSQYDGDRVFPIIEQMTRDGYRIWFNDAVTPGANRPETIAAKLNGAEACIAIISRQTLSDEGSRKEISYAMLKRKYFISLFLESVRLTPGMEQQLSSYRSIPAYRLPDAETCFRELYAVPKLNACKGAPDPSVLVSALPLRPAPQVLEPIQQPVQQPVQQPIQKPVQQPAQRLQQPVQPFVPPVQPAQQVRQQAQQQVQQPVQQQVQQPVQQPVQKPVQQPVQRPVQTPVQQPDLSSDATVYEPSRRAAAETGEVKRILSDYQLVRLSTGKATDVLMGVFVIGRAADRVDYAIPDVPSIGRVHAKLVANPAGCTITDNNSMNKTSVNGVFLEPNKAYPLSNGDIISLASEQFLFRKVRR